MFDQYRRGHLRIVWAVKVSQRFLEFLERSGQQAISQREPTEKDRNLTNFEVIMDISNDLHDSPDINADYGGTPRPQINAAHEHVQNRSRF